MTSLKGDINRRPLTIYYLDWGTPYEAQGDLVISSSEIAIQFANVTLAHVDATPQAHGALQDVDRKLVAMLSFAKPYLLHSCRWTGDIQIVAVSADEQDLATFVVASLGDERAEASLVHENGDMCRLEWECGILFSQTWKKWVPTEQQIMLYQVDEGGQTTSAELEISLPEGVCGQEPVFDIGPIPQWQMFVPYLKDPESKLLVVQFDFDSMPVLRTDRKVTEEDLRTFACIGNRRFLVRCGDLVDLRFEKSGFDQPIIISGV